MSANQIDRTQQITVVVWAFCHCCVRFDKTIVLMRAGCLDNQAHAPGSIVGNNMTWRNHNSALVLHMHSIARPTTEHIKEKSCIVGTAFDNHSAKIDMLYRPSYIT